MGMEDRNKPRNEVAKRADTERLELARKARNENQAESSRMSVKDLNGLKMLPNDPENTEIDAIEGNVNGVKFEGHKDRGGSYHVRLDGEWLPQADARQAYLHVSQAIGGRDTSNRVAIRGIDREIDYVEMHEPRIGKIRDKFYGGQSPEHEGFSGPLEDQEEQAA